MKIVPISKEIHREWSYIGLTDYLPTRNDALVPIVIAEITRLISTNPIIFVEETDLGVFSLQGLTPGRNLMVNEKGKWLGDYIPARYRSMPFVLANDSNNKNNEKILCFIDGLNCVAQSFKQKSTKIFKDDKPELSDDMKRVFEFLQSIDQNEKITKQALETIREANVLEDWTISLKLSDGEKKFSGLKKVNIEKLKSLSGKTLEKMNKTGGLDICFASNLSLNNLDKLRNIVISSATQKESKQNENPIETIRDRTIKKQKEAKKEEMDNLVRNLLLDDEI